MFKVVDKGLFIKFKVLGLGLIGCVLLGSCHRDQFEKLSMEDQEAFEEMEASYQNAVDYNNSLINCDRESLNCDQDYIAYCDSLFHHYVDQWEHHHDKYDHDGRHCDHELEYDGMHNHKHRNNHDYEGGHHEYHHELMEHLVEDHEPYHPI